MYDVIVFDSVAPVAAPAAALVAEAVEHATSGKRQRKCKPKSADGSPPKKANFDTFVMIGHTRSPRVVASKAILELCCQVDSKNDTMERKNTIFALSYNQICTDAESLLWECSTLYKKF